MKPIFSKLWNVLNGILNVGWKAGVAIVAMCIAVDYFEVYEDDLYEIFHPWEFDEDVSPTLFTKYNSSQDCYRVYNWETGRRASREKFLYVSQAGYSDRVLFRDLNYKYGYLDSETGKVAIRQRYRDAFEFSNEGLAAVLGFRDDSLRFITTTGELAFDKAFPHVDDYHPRFHHGCCIIRERTEEYGVRYGLIDLEGNWIFKPEYKYMEHCAGGEWLLVVVEGKDGEVLEGRWNYKGYWEYDPVYENIECENGSVFLTRDGVRWKDSTK